MIRGESEDRGRTETFDSIHYKAIYEIQRIITAKLGVYSVGAAGMEEGLGPIFSSRSS